jgi:hypothetical protein
MGKESVQIKTHIDEERARLDMNIAKLERDFEFARDFVTSFWKRPLALAGIAFGILVVVANEVSTRRRGKTQRTTGTAIRDMAA